VAKQVRSVALDASADANPRTSGSDSGGRIDFGGIILEIATNGSILFAAHHIAVVFEQSF
jgi:hypothetical protein